MNVRKPAVAGLFYEAEAGRLRQQVAALLGVGGEIKVEASPKALIVPHAGLIYSGATAARAYRLLEPLCSTIERVVLLGPAHRVYLEGMAVPGADAFATPLGEVRLDRQSIERIKSLPGVCSSEQAHRDEHSLEVQLPFLQTVLDNFLLVPVVVGHVGSGPVAAVIDALWGGPETLVIISSDLSHFHSYAEARKLDALTCDRLLARESALQGEEACGARALNGLMRSRQCRALEVKLLALCNSGDTAGDKNRVVGYGSFLLH